MNSRNKGFTLIEILVVIALIGILATTMVVNFSKNEDRDVRQEKERLTTFLRAVQNKALVGDKSDISTITNKLCGYGAYYDSDGNVQAYYVSDADPDADCSVGSSTASTDDLDGDKFVPRNGVVITDFTGEEIFFKVPAGDVYIAGSKPITDFSIEFEDSTVTVVITPGGVIK